MQSFSDCRSGWSKEPQWENDCGSFLPCFLLVPIGLECEIENIVVWLECVLKVWPSWRKACGKFICIEGRLSKNFLDSILRLWILKMKFVVLEVNYLMDDQNSMLWGDIFTKRGEGLQVVVTQHRIWMLRVSVVSGFVKDVWSYTSHDALIENSLACQLRNRYGHGEYNKFTQCTSHDLVISWNRLGGYISSSFHLEGSKLSAGNSLKHLEVPE
jgi:hypothetical protein